MAEKPGCRVVENQSTVVFQHGSAEIVVDKRYLPGLLVTAWRGKGTEEVVRAYYAWQRPFHRRLVDAQQHFVIIVDATLNEIPAADARKAIADNANVDLDVAKECLRLVVIVAPNALLRGALTAVSWLLKRELSMAPVRTLQEALEVADKGLRDAGIDIPPGWDPATYSFPGPPGVANVVGL